MESPYIFLVQKFHREGPVFSTSVCTFTAPGFSENFRSWSGRRSKLPSGWNSCERWNMGIAFESWRSRVNRGASIRRKTSRDLGRFNGQEIHLRDGRGRFLVGQRIGVRFDRMLAGRTRVYCQPVEV